VSFRLLEASWLIIRRWFAGAAGRGTGGDGCFHPVSNFDFMGRGREKGGARRRTDSSRCLEEIVTASIAFTSPRQDLGFVASCTYTAKAFWAIQWSRVV